MVVSNRVKIASAALIALLSLGTAYYFRDWFDPLYREMRAEFSSDPQVNMDIGVLAKSAADLYRNLGISSVSRQTGNAIRNCTIANMQLGLPLDTNALKYLISATEKSGDIVDFAPVNITDMNGKVYSIQSLNIARDTWMIAENLRRNPQLVEKVKWYLALSAMAQQNGWDFFDNPGNPNYPATMMKAMGMKADDPRVWEIVDQMRDWLFNEDRMGFPLDLPHISNSTDKKICYSVLFELPTEVSDFDASPWITNGVRVWKQHEGLDAMRYYVKQMSRFYNEIMKLYPDGKFYEERIINDVLVSIAYDPRREFYYRLADRAGYGHKESVALFLGVDILELNIRDMYKASEVVKNWNGIDSYLDENWENWDLIKFIDGYRVANFGIENKISRDALKVLLNAFGIPCIPEASINEEYAPDIQSYLTGLDSAFLGMPDRVVQHLKNKVQGYLSIPGNGLQPLIISKDGIQKDIDYGIQNPNHTLKYTDVYLPIRGDKIYLLRIGKKG
ncbi:MAG: hypothetical protein NWE95_01850 [Candidatus Bathyarchaeota archaeon]|nr:hypothetical protein [Candidatus Bathyarchaeota archaeon]